jgi:hypothetical protein
MKEDVLYDFSLSTSTLEFPAMFGDVKVKPGSNSRNLSYTSILLYDTVKPTHRWFRGARFLGLLNFCKLLLFKYLNEQVK